MTTLQKIIKLLATVFAVVLIIGILGGLLGLTGLFGGIFSGDAVLEEPKVYSVEGQIYSLNIHINAADLTVRQADTFSVESNLKYLSVSQKNGILTIQEEKKFKGTYTDAMLVINIPSGMQLDKVSIITGAARLTADTLCADSLDLQLGAGDVQIGSLNAASEANIEGGAGKVTISGGTLNNLELEMGVGELNLTAALHGSSDLHFGVGASNLTLIGSKEDYRVQIEKGIGSVRVDGESVSDFGSSGSGENRVDIEGGIGAINIQFRNP